MAIRLATAAQTAYDAVFDAAKDDALDAAFDLVDAGAAAGEIEVYSGAVPAAPGDAPAGTLLATFTLADPGFAASAAAAKALDADPDLTTATVASGTPAYARALDSNGAVVFDGTVGTSGADFITSSSPWASAQTVDLTTGSVSIP
jgi:hypothetical protein